MTGARELFEQGSWAKALGALEQYREPDGVYDREKQLLAQLCTLELARQAIRDGREIYAGQLLESCPEEGGYCAQALRREKLLLSARLPGADRNSLCAALPSLDDELLLRAEAALDANRPDRCGRLLAAAEDWENPRWNLLMGRLAMTESRWASAAEYLQKAEEAPALPLLEVCFRELGDFRRAYECACRQRR
jgi:uncharacterized protein HemY